MKHRANTEIGHNNAKLLTSLQLYSSHINKLSLHTNTTWEMSHQARRVTLPNEASKESITVQS